MIFVNIRLQHLVCAAAQNIWSGAWPSLMLQLYYVYINITNSWERMFWFYSQLITSLFLFNFSILLKNGFWKNVWEKRSRTLMCRWRPTRVSVQITDAFIVMAKTQSASQVSKQILFRVWDAQHVGTALRSTNFTMVPCKSHLITRSLSQIARPWELVESGFTNMKLLPTARSPGGCSLSLILWQKCLPAILFSQV